MFTLLAVLLVVGFLVDILVFKSWENVKILLLLVSFFGIMAGILLLGTFLTNHFHIP